MFYIVFIDMKVILTESQYRGMVERIKDFENKLEFMKKNLQNSLETDIGNHLYTNYPCEKKQYGINPTDSYQINLDYLSNEIGHRARILVWIDVKNKYVQAMVSIGGIPMGSIDSMTTIKWYLDDENGEETFYTKLDKSINQRLSEKYQDKIIDKYKKRISP